MTRLHIEHATVYRYARPVTFGRHRLVLRPREGHDLRIEDMQLRLEPAHTLLWTRDVFGNSIAIVDWREPSAVLSIVNDVIVERFQPFPEHELPHHPQLMFPPIYDGLERGVAESYLQPSYPEAAEPLREWAAGAFPSHPHDAERTMSGLCEAVHRTVVYQRRSEKGVQEPIQTLERRLGSCRDMATLMMETARSIGVAARFASGYLHGSASMAGHASTHAWAEIYLPFLGWRGYDPTLGTPISLSHIVTGVSSHPRGVMPVSGMFTGRRSDCESMTVTVRTELC